MTRREQHRRGTTVLPWMGDELAVEQDTRGGYETQIAFTRC